MEVYLEYIKKFFCGSDGSGFSLGFGGGHHDRWFAGDVQSQRDLHPVRGAWSGAGGEADFVLHWVDLL